MARGRLFLILSAVLYGMIPSLSAIAYRGGMNGITLTFLRSAISVPVLYAVIRSDKRVIYQGQKQLCRLILLGVFGGAMPILLLYMSYQYISTSLATSLHFVYPVITVIASSILGHVRPSRVIVTAAVIVTGGVYMFASGAADGRGTVLALLSGVFYSFYVIYIKRSGLYRADLFVVTFYIAVIMSIFVLIFGASVISFRGIEPYSWSLAALISFIANLGAVPLFQLGVRYTGAAEAGIYSGLEPVTGIVMGVTVLGEMAGTSQLLGGALIILGVLLVSHEKSGI